MWLCIYAHFPGLVHSPVDLLAGLLAPKRNGGQQSLVGAMADSCLVYVMTPGPPGSVVVAQLSQQHATDDSHPWQPEPDALWLLHVRIGQIWA